MTERLYLLVHLRLGQQYEYLCNVREPQNTIQNARLTAFLRAPEYKPGISFSLIGDV